MWSIQVNQSQKKGEKKERRMAKKKTGRGRGVIKKKECVPARLSSIVHTEQVSSAGPAAIVLKVIAVVQARRGS